MGPKNEFQRANAELGQAWPGGGDKPTSAGGWSGLTSSHYQFLNHFQLPDVNTEDLELVVMTEAENPKPVGGYRGAAKVAVFDDFRLDQEDYNHGQTVETILLQTGGFEPYLVQGFQNTPYMEPLARNLATVGPHVFGHALHAYIEKFPAAGLAQTSINLEALLSEDYPELVVVNQSQAISPLQATLSILELSGVNVLSDRPAVEGHFGEQLAAHLGYSLEVDVTEFVQAVSEHVYSIQHESELVAEQLGRYDELSELAFSHGVGYFIAAGNSAHQLEAIRALGVQLAEDFHRSWFKNDFNLVVGASDAEGREAFFSTPGADLALNGTHVLPGFDGTSFAAPQVSAVFVSLRKSRPRLEVEQLYQLLLDSCVPGDERLGAGILEANRFLRESDSL